MDTADSPHSAGAPLLICSPTTRGPERRNHAAPPGASRTSARSRGASIIRDVYTVLYTGCVSWRVVRDFTWAGERCVALPVAVACHSSGRCVRDSLHAHAVRGDCGRQSWQVRWGGGAATYISSSD